MNAIWLHLRNYSRASLLMRCVMACLIMLLSFPAYCYAYFEPVGGDSPQIMMLLKEMSSCAEGERGSLIASLIEAVDAVEVDDPARKPIVLLPFLICTDDVSVMSALIEQLSGKNAMRACAVLEPEFFRTPWETGYVRSSTVTAPLKDKDVQNLFKASSSKSASVRGAATRLLAIVPEKYRPQVQRHLINAYQTEADSSVRASICDTVGCLAEVESGSSLDEALVFLAGTSLTDPPKEVCLAIAYRASNLKTKALKLAQGLEKMLHYPDRDVRCAAIQAAGEIGPGCKIVIRTFCTILMAEEDPDYGLEKYHILEALKKLAPSSVAALPTLIALLEILPARDLAAENLALLGPSAAPAVKGLAKMLEQGAACHRIAAAKALAEIGKQAQPAVAALRKASLDNRDDFNVMQGQAAQMAARQALDKIAKAAGSR